MGCDIHGKIEVQRTENSDYWWALMDIGTAVGRSYDAFGALFGVRNYSNFAPVAEKRGLPANLSPDTEDAVDSWGGGPAVNRVDFHSASYLTYDEIQAIDWDAESEVPDERYSVLDADKEPTGTKFGHSTGWADIIDENQEALAAGEAVPNEAGDKYIQRRTPTRREAIEGQWEWLLFDQLDLIMERFHDARLVVWFDN